MIGSAEWRAGVEWAIKLAEEYDALYPVTREDTYGAEYEAGAIFADLLRDKADDLMPEPVKIMCQCGHPLDQHANGTCNPGRPGYCPCSSPQGMI